LSKKLKTPHPPLKRSPFSRCDSVTLGEKQRTVLFFNTLVPLRYPLGKAKDVPEIESFMRKNCDYYLKTVSELNSLLFDN
jgi:hypothetical protein